jgi:predicted methyltransferase
MTLPSGRAGRPLILAALLATALGAAAPGHAQEQRLRDAPRASAPPATTEDQTLIALIGGAQRTAPNTARDGWRHPLESLTFWGLQPGLTVLEIQPSGGYWTEILAPYAAKTGGHYVAAGLPGGDPGASDAARKARAAFEAKVADQAVFGVVSYDDFSAAGGLVAPPASVDMILTARNIHDWMWTPGAVDRDLASFAAALKPGGILAVEEHRADPRAMVPEARDGYVSEDYVIAEARKAGLVLEARSDVNANPKDSKNHPFGVWTLPPTRRSAPSGQPANPSFDHARYDAIGESDRMTLRFRKPA